MQKNVECSILGARYIAPGGAHTLNLPLQNQHQLAGGGHPTLYVNGGYLAFCGYRVPFGTGATPLNRHSSLLGGSDESAFTLLAQSTFQEDASHAVYKGPEYTPEY